LDLWHINVATGCLVFPLEFFILIILWLCVLLLGWLFILA
jgi:hypothetical protein